MAAVSARDHAWLCVWRDYSCFHGNGAVRCRLRRRRFSSTDTCVIRTSYSTTVQRSRQMYSRFSWNWYLEVCLCVDQHVCLLFPIALAIASFSAHQSGNL